MGLREAEGLRGAHSAAKLSSSLESWQQCSAGSTYTTVTSRIPLGPVTAGGEKEKVTLALGSEEDGEALGTGCPHELWRLQAWKGLK